MTKPSPRHLPQLDSLRALAVSAVMVHHWAPGFLGFRPWGELGVRCFFVLSGFLITGILLRARAEVESGRSAAGWQMRQFYIRRSLRIFPVYYLTLSVGALLGMHVLRETFWWHASYVSNIYFALRGTWQGYISHLWSLAVEEQFYLLWPAVVLLLPDRRLPVLMGAGIVAGVLSRACLAAAFGADHITLTVLLPSCLDPLMAGALLAWLQRPGASGAGSSIDRLLRHAPWVDASFFVYCVLDHLQWGKTMLAVVGPLVQAAFFAGVIARCARGVPGRIGQVLDLAPLRYLGRISYGLYLYHMFAGYMAGMFADKLGLAVPASGSARFALYFAMSFVAAALSERLIERPFNRLKRFFPSEGRPPGTTSVAITGPVLFGGGTRTAR